MHFGDDAARGRVITALHGFLGLPSDWRFLEDAGPSLQAIDLFRESIPTRGDVLAGYSMGGRLALQSLLSGSTYRAAIFLSTRVSDAEPGRLQSDQAWAKRFESEDWAILMSDWNRQTVFGGDAIVRREANFDRGALARALREWSPAALPSVLGRLHELRIPTLWLAGSKDAKYVAEARMAAERIPDAKVDVIENAGHRMLFDEPEAVARAILKFIRSL